jgi:hypothetical protein
MITGMPRASLTEDGELLEIEFSDDTGGIIALQFAADTFERILVRATELVMGARIQKLTMGDHFAVHAVDAVGVTAQAPVGGGKVILALRTDNALPYHFALSADEAERLRPELYRAVRSARKQSALPRH